jgi:hypothetical protein
MKGLDLLRVADELIAVRSTFKRATKGPAISCNTELAAEDAKDHAREGSSAHADACVTVSV